MQIVSVNAITKGQASDDGTTTSIRFAQADGGEIEIAFPVSMMQSLIMLASSLMAQAADKREERDKFEYVTASSWGMSHFPDGRLLLYLALPGGGKLSFALPPSSFQQMVQIVDNLKTRLGGRPDGTAIN